MLVANIIQFVVDIRTLVELTNRFGYAIDSNPCFVHGMTARSNYTHKHPCYK